MKLAETLKHYSISIMAPARSKVVGGTKWVARIESPYQITFGDTPEEAVEKIVKLQLERYSEEG